MGGSDGTPVRVSIVIPTYERGQAVRRQLEHLAQSESQIASEVIVVDDGSVLQKPDLSDIHAPFAVRLLRQANQGATAARNHGADAAVGDVLIFMDDDIFPSGHCLHALAQAAATMPRCIALGTLHTIAPDPLAAFSRYVTGQELQAQVRDLALAAGGQLRLSGERCLTGLLAVRRSDFDALGGFQDPTGGWPNWDDVDFGYRAELKGLQLLRLTDAIAEHRDSSLSDPMAAADRWYRAARSAPLLFQRYPALTERITMFKDMGPVDLRHDSLVLVIRRLVRRLSAIRWVASAFLWLGLSADQLLGWPPATAAFFRVGLGGFKCAGFRDGLARQASPAHKRA